MNYKLLKKCKLKCLKWLKYENNSLNIKIVERRKLVRNTATSKLKKSVLFKILY